VKVGFSGFAGWAWNNAMNDVTQQIVHLSPLNGTYKPGKERKYEPISQLALSDQAATVSLSETTLLRIKLKFP
jgi:hypothetical protein